jgi:hypothetical protein
LNTNIAISYVSPPAVTGVTATTPTGGGTGPLMPVMQATGTDYSGSGLAYQYAFTSSNGGAAFTSPWVADGPYPVPQGSLTPGKAYSYTISVRDNLATSPIVTATNAAWKFVTNVPAPTPPQAQVVPGDGSIVTSLTPTFSAPNPGVSTVSYQFRLSTGADGKSGQVTLSGWLPTTTPGAITWAPPAGTLQDGGSYTVSVMTKDAYDSAVDPTWVSHFTVNQRIGAAGPSPKDTVGPVTVNLANGNVNLQFASPTVATLGGPMGLSFAYNSLIAADKYKGLTGTYYNALNAGQTSTTTFDATGRTPVLVRTDPNVSFNWGTGSPAPSVPSDYFLARWSGFVQVPATGGPYTFGVQTDDGAKLSIGGTSLVTNWPATTGGGTIVWGSAATTATAPTPIQFDYYDSTGSASATLWVKNGAGTSYVVPSDWLTTTYLPLPVGWSPSTAIVGNSSVYASALVTDTAVVLTDVSGTAHTYTKASTGGYTAPSGEYGILTLDSAGLVTLVGDDGTVYAFNAQGKVASITSPGDAKKRATPIPSYDPTTGRVTKISDPVSSNGATPAAYGKEVLFGYSDGTAGSCPLLAGFASPVQAGMLCQITYPGHTVATDTTRLFYVQTPIAATPSNPAGGVVTQLAEILDPGDAATTFGYDSTGRLSSVRNQVANDWVTIPGHTASDANATTITYDSAGRAVTVSLPAPDGVTISSRPQKTYTYDTANSTTYVDVTGLNLTGSPIGHAGKVTYDAGWRTLTTTSAMGVTTTNTWSNKDQLLSTTDSTGHETTTIYDPRTDRPTDTYGPAPVACFTTARLPQPCSMAVPPAHSHTGYDETTATNQGLQVAYYNNSNLSGPPALFSLGVLGGPTDGSVNANWGTGSPDPTIGVDNFSIRLTGTITFPAAGTYILKTLSDDGARVWVNDVNVVDDWVAHGAAALQGNTALTVTATTLTQRIRAEYFEGGGGASMALYWSINGATAVVVPGSALHPDYGLVTSTTTDDSVPTGSGLSAAAAPSTTVTTGYGTSPWLGTPITSTVDPTGLNLTTTMTYEAATVSANSWLRRLNRALPSAASTPTDATKTTTSAYYSDSEAVVSATCGVPAGTKEYGFLKSSTSPTPASGSAVVTQYVYDVLGRLAGTKRTGDTGWTCSYFDARGRVSSQTFPDTTARTVTYGYTADGTATGDPLTTWMSDSAVPGSPKLTTVSDLLGRTVTSTDVWGTTTTPTYDSITGRVTSVSTAPPGATPGSFVTPTL